MKLFAEFMVDQALLCGAPWRKMTEIYFEEYTKSPKKTFIKIVFIFIFFLDAVFSYSWCRKYQNTYLPSL
jgi:hypothetical protein